MSDRSHFAHLKTTKMRRQAARLMLLVALCTMLATPARLLARTEVFDASIVDRIAGIAEDAPRQGLALQPWGASFYSVGQVLLTQDRSMMLRFALDKIPADHRIAHAELVVPVRAVSGNEPRFYLWRTVANWGPGVCWKYQRVVKDTPVPWAREGARGIGMDRAAQPTDVLRLTNPQDIVVNVTEDIDLWHSGAAPNRGWMFTVEDPDVVVNLWSPIWDGVDRWKLRVTYEPK